MRDHESAPDSDALSPGDITRFVWAARWYLLSGLVIGAGIAIVIAFLMTPVYRAEVTVVPLDAVEGSSLMSGLSSQLGGLAALAGVNSGSGEFRQEALAYLRSRAIAEQLIRSQRLLTVILERDGRKATMTDAVRRFREGILNVSEDRRSGIVTVTIEWQDPALAAAWANELVRLANENLRNRTIREAEATHTYLVAQVAKTSIVEIRTAIYRLIEAQLKSVSVASSRQDFAFRIVDPAVVVDPDDEVRPSKPLFAVLGAMLGAGCGGLAFLALSRRRATARRSAARD